MDFKNLLNDVVAAVTAFAFRGYDAIVADVTDGQYLLESLSVTELTIDRVFLFPAFNDGVIRLAVITGGFGQLAFTGE